MFFAVFFEDAVASAASIAILAIDIAIWAKWNTLSIANKAWYPADCSSNICFAAPAILAYPANWFLRLISCCIAISFSLSAWVLNSLPTPTWAFCSFSIEPLPWLETTTSLANESVSLPTAEPNSPNAEDKPSPKLEVAFNNLLYLACWIVVSLVTFNIACWVSKVVLAALILDWAICSWRCSSLFNKAIWSASSAGFNAFILAFNSVAFSTNWVVISEVCLTKSTWALWLPRISFCLAAYSPVIFNNWA